MNTQSPEYKRVREEIAKELCMQSSLVSDLTEYQKCAYWEGIHETWRKKYRKRADSILTIKGIVILADNQSAPTEIVSCGYNCEDLLKDFRKVV